MNKNIRKSLLTLITILTLITPSSNKKSNGEEEMSFASRFYINDKLIERIEEDYFYIKDEEIEEVLEQFGDYIKGIYYNSSSQTNDEYSINTYKKISLEKETIKIALGSNSFKMTLISYLNNNNKVTVSFNKFPMFENSIEYMSIYSTTIEDQFGNTLKKESNKSMLQDKNTTELNIKTSYGDFNIRISQLNLNEEKLYYIMLNNEADSIYGLVEEEYKIIVDYLTSNQTQADFAIMLNDINYFIDKTKNKTSKTI